MKPLVLALACLVLAPGVTAQPPTVSAEVIAYLDDIEKEMGIKRFGPTVMGEGEELEEVTVVVPVSPDAPTYIQVACDDLCEAIYASATGSSGHVIDQSDADIPDPVLTIPAGNGSEVSITVEIGYCDNWACEFLIQPFVR